MLGSPLGARLRVRVAHPQRPTPVADPAQRERIFGFGRGVSAVALGLLVAVHRPAFAPAAMVAIALLVTTALCKFLPVLDSRLPERLRTPQAIFAMGALTCVAISVAYPAPDLLSWVPFVLLIAAGGARWTLTGATVAYAVYLLDAAVVAHFEGALFSVAGPAGIRLAIIGLTSTIIGFFARSAHQFQALQARTAALADSRKALRSILDTSPAAVVTVDAAGAITDWSRRAEQLFQRDAETVAGARFDTLLRGGGDAEPWRPSPSVDGPVAAVAVRRDGVEVHVEMVVSEPLRIAGATRHAVFVTDVSARRRTDLRRELLAAVARVFAESPSLDSGVERFLQVMGARLDWGCGRLWRLDPETQSLRLLSSWHAEDVDTAALDAVDGDLQLEKGGLLAGVAWEHGAPVVAAVGDLRLTPRRRALAHAGMEGGIAFPISTDGGVVGVAEFFAARPILLDDLLDVLTGIGAHCGLFMVRRNEEAAHRETAVRLQSLLDSVADGIITFDEHGAIESANHATGHLFDCTAEQLTRSTLDMLLAPARRSGLAARLERGAMEWETEGLRRDGSVFPMDLRASEMRLEGRRLFIATLRDTSELKARTMALQHQAMHDNLTGLPNRTLLTDRLGQAISSAARAGRPAALLLMDMDGFKEVNDSLGHHCGDTLLRQVADRLRLAVRAEDTVARLGGDEFAILPAGPCDEETALAIADKVLDAFTMPFLIEEQVIHAGMSIGVAVYPGHGDDAGVLMRRADMAMYAAKRMRTGRSAYTPAQDAHGKRRLDAIAYERSA